MPSPAALAWKDSSSAITGQNLYVYYATGESATRYSFTDTTLGNWNVTAVEISGQAANNFIDDEGILANINATTTPTSYNIDATQANDLVLAGLVGGGNWVQGTPPPAVTTENAAYTNLIP